MPEDSSMILIWFDELSLAYLLRLLLESQTSLNYPILRELFFSRKILHLTLSFIHSCERFGKFCATLNVMGVVFVVTFSIAWMYFQVESSLTLKITDKNCLCIYKMATSMKNVTFCDLREWLCLFTIMNSRIWAVSH